MPETASKNVLIIDDSPYNIFVLEELIKALDPKISI